MRIARVCALITLLMGAMSCFAGDWWLDPGRGCGTKEAWIKTHHIEDLPGCDGDLPRDASPGEIAMHNSKSLMRTAERILDQKHTNGVEDVIERASSTIDAAPAESRVTDSRQYYKEAIGLLSGRLRELDR
jgi:hypothetical protein